MKTIRRTNQFKKDIKLAQKQGKDFSVLKKVVEDLCKGRQFFLVPMLQRGILYGMHSHDRAWDEGINSQ